MDRVWATGRGSGKSRVSGQANTVQLRARLAGLIGEDKGLKYEVLQGKVGL
jgi:hypothetical protein